MPSCTGRPRLYVYNLPSSYRIDPRDAPAGMGAPSRLPPLEHMPLGVRLWHTAEFGLGSLFMQRALDYQCVTTDPELADLFLIPAFSGRLVNRPTEKSSEPMPAEMGGRLRALFTRLRQVRVHRCGAGARHASLASSGIRDSGHAVGRPSRGALSRAGLARNCSALKARGGADHILINPRNGAPNERRPMWELDYMDARLGNVTLLDLMEPGDWPWQNKYKPERRYHSMPHPSVIHLEPGASGLPWRSRHVRSVLVAGAFGLIHSSRMDKDVTLLRRALTTVCARAAERDCRYHRLELLDNHGRASHPPPPLDAAAAVPREPRWHAISRLYWDATFCLQPPGDAVSRKAIIDSLLLGCIPVLFHRGQQEQWPWHWGSWRENASVLIEGDDVIKKRLNPIEVLKAIPPDRIRSMQRTIAANAHQMQYAAVDTALLDTALLDTALEAPSDVRPSAEAKARLTQASASAATTSSPASTGTASASSIKGASEPERRRLPDAFDIALSQAWMRATDRATIEAGWRTQRVEGAALEAALDIFDREPKYGSWGGSNVGMCKRTKKRPGDCEVGDSGTWVLGPGSQDVFLPRGLWSLDDCTESCRRCARCRWIALSHAHNQCDWYNSCNTSKLLRTRGMLRRTGADTFKTRLVKLS